MLKRKRSTSPTDIVDGDSTPVPPPTTALSSETSALDKRPRLSISRHPVFPPDAAPDLPLFSSSQDATVLPVFNRLGFRYTAAGLSEPGSALPARTIESVPQCYRASFEDRSPSIKISPDGLNLQGSHGFKSVRTNAPLREGKWYIEVEVLDAGQPSYAAGGAPGPSSSQVPSHVRLGFSRREAPLNGPVGMDAYSYGYRDMTGEKVTLARPKAYAKSFGKGDVVGMYISLPARPPPNAQDPNDPARIKRERIAIDYKGQEYFESLEYSQTKEMRTLMTTPSVSIPSGSSKAAASVPTSVNFSPKKSATVKNLPERGRGPRARPALPVADLLRPLPKLEGSRIAFFVNGESQGTAFSEIYDYLPLKSSSATQKSKKRTRDGGLEHKENPFDDGTLGYYPTISLFNDARVRINPGPNFRFPPPEDIDAVLEGREPAVAIKAEGEDGDGGYSGQRIWRPVCERYSEYMAEQWVLDVEDEKLAKIELAERMEEDLVETRKKAERDKKRKEQEAKRRATKDAKSRMATGSPAPGAYLAPSHAESPSTSHAASPAPTAVYAIQRSETKTPTSYTDHVMDKKPSYSDNAPTPPAPTEVEIRAPSPPPPSTDNVKPEFYSPSRVHDLADILQLEAPHDSSQPQNSELHTYSYQY